MRNELIAYLKLFHGAYNTGVILLFIYQGILGLRIRKSVQKPYHVIRRHRQLGPFAAVLGIAGFIAGTSIAYIDKGRIFIYPFHFLMGLTIITLIVITYFISKKIRNTEPLWRDRHYVIGVSIMCLYFIQAFAGLGILL